MTLRSDLDLILPAALAAADPEAAVRASLTVKKNRLRVAGTTLDLGEAGWQMAEVRWAEDGQLGLRFLEAFDLDTLAPARTDTDASPDMLKPAYLESETRPDSPWASRTQRLSMTELKMIDPEH